MRKGQTSSKVMIIKPRYLKDSRMFRCKKEKYERDVFKFCFFISVKSENNPD